MLTMDASPSSCNHNHNNHHHNHHVRLHRSCPKKTNSMSSQSSNNSSNSSSSSYSRDVKFVWLALSLQLLGVLVIYVNLAQQQQEQPNDTRTAFFLATKRTTTASTTTNSLLLRGSSSLSSAQPQPQPNAPQPQENPSRIKPQQSQQPQPQSHHSLTLTEQILQMEAQAKARGDAYQELEDDGQVNDYTENFPIEELDKLTAIQRIARLSKTTTVKKDDQIPLEDATKLAHYRQLYQEQLESGTLVDYTLLEKDDNVIQPRTDIHTHNPVAVLVLSAVDHVEQRNAIRSTWGQGHQVYFVIGQGSTESDSNDDSLLLQHEVATYQDILQVPCPESYHSLAFKLKRGLEFVVDQLPHVQWITKLDDDMVARLDTLQRVVLDPLNPHHPWVIGHVQDRAPVVRPDTLHKTQVHDWVEYLYPHTYYPPFCLGSYGYVLSSTVAQQVARMSKVIYYQGEDTSLGIWLSDSGSNHQQHKVHWHTSPFLDNHGSCSKDNPWIISGHGLSPDEMRDCYRQLDEWPEPWVQDTIRAAEKE